MKVVYKYSVNTEMFPIGHEVVKVGIQDDAVMLWCLVDPKARLGHSKYQVFGTGQPIPDGSLYIGTAFEWPWVWHVFKVK